MISIIGAGRVGSTAAFSLALKELGDIKLVDIMEKVPQGEALDLMHAAHSGFCVDVLGTNDFRDIEGSGIVINTAGLARKPGMDRLDLLQKNRQIVSSVAESIKKFAPDAIVIQVSNPMDVMNFVMHKVTGFERERVIGMGGMLDAQRFSLFLARELDAKPMDVKSMVIGEHGESMVPLFSQSFLDSRPVSELLSEEQKKTVLEKTRKAGAEVIGLKGATVFAPAIAITRMVENIVKNKREMLPVSCYLQGEYGVKDVCIGVPARLGKSGLEEIIELGLEDEEKNAFLQSAEKLKKIISELGI